MMLQRAFAATLLLIGLAACSTTRTDAPVGAEAYATLDSAARPPEQGYPLGPLDEIAINVFYEPELSFESVVIDNAGSFPYPFIGTVQAAGRTPAEIAALLRDRLSQGYVVDPQVSVFVIESSQQKLAIEGEVTKPGVYPIRGPSSLIEAVALAGGPLRTADLDQVIVFRKRDDAVFAARFDLEQVRAGTQPNPILQGGDTVVVGIDSASRLYRDVLQVAPLLSVIFLRL